MKPTHPATQSSNIRVRPYEPADHEFVLSLAPRLLIGAARWIEPELMLAAVRGWIGSSIVRSGGETMVFVAEDASQTRLGFASVSRNQHFTGVPQAYIGELAVDAAVEGRGAGRALIQACEQWAREQGLTRLALDTGFANEHGRGFYARLGFKEESVKLVRLINPQVQRSM